MTNIDQFESVFKAATRTPYRHEAVDLRSLLVVTDMTPEADNGFVHAVKQFLAEIEPEDGWQLQLASGSEFESVGQLLELVQRADTDLVCTYRNLHSTAWKWPHSLGDYLDVLSQVAEPPVLVFPHPADYAHLDWISKATNTVMAITDHLAGDHHLVSYAAAMTKPGGKLLLTHVEDQAALRRVLDQIAKIPSLDTEVAREEIPRQLLKEPHDYITSCRQTLEELGFNLQVEEVITLGHFLADHLRIVEQHDVDLLVLNTKDDDQAAMHGLAYPLSVELRKKPVLLL